MMNSTTLYVLAAIILTAFFSRAGWEVYTLFRAPDEQRIRVQAQRLLLRFCKRPTKERYEEAWTFIADNDVMLGDLDWPLVQRFTRMAVTYGNSQKPA